MTVLLFLSLAITGVSAQQPDAVSGEVARASQQQASATAAPAPQATSLNATSARDRQICRRQARIGTLAGFESICHSEAEWRVIARGSQASWQQIQGALGSTHGREGASLVCSPNGVGC